MKPIVLFVGYEVGGGALPPPECIPTFEDKGGKNPRTAEEQRKDWIDAYWKTPYGGFISACSIIDPHGEFVEFSTHQAVFRPRSFPKGTPVPVALQVAGWLEKRYGKDLAPNLAAQFEPGTYQGTVSFLGFEPRRFIKHMGIECARLGHPMRSGFWFSNSDHRDMAKALLPEPFDKEIELELALKQMGLWREGFVPNTSARADAIMALRIALQLGLIQQAKDIQEFLAEVDAEEAVV